MLIWSNTSLILQNKSCLKTPFKLSILKNSPLGKGVRKLKVCNINKLTQLHVPFEVYEQTNLWNVNICTYFSHFYFELSMWFVTAYSFGRDSEHSLCTWCGYRSTAIAMFQNLHPYLWLKSFLRKPGQMSNSCHQEER